MGTSLISLAGADARRSGAFDPGTAKTRLRVHIDATSDVERDQASLSPVLHAIAQCPPEHRAAARLPELVPDAAEADVLALPRIWTCYTGRGRLAEATATAHAARRMAKSVLVWHTGDLTPIVPFDNAVVLTNAYARSTRARGYYVAPRFIEDPLPTYARGELTVREKGEKPLVGFCGYANAAAWKVGYSVVHGIHLRLAAAGGGALFEPPPLVPAAVLRAKVLRALDRNRHVQTAFIVRTRYRGGARAAGKDHPTVVEFYGNILKTDYTVCVRGYGNWSIRLYETLACGRIPIIIDTDCGLPFDDVIDWRQYSVWVPVEDVARVGDYVAEFHGRMSPMRFRELQRECRALWAARLTLRGFVSHLHECVHPLGRMQVDSTCA
jgi:hypothetical protein